MFLSFGSGTSLVFAAVLVLLGASSAFSDESCYRSGQSLGIRYTGCDGTTKLPNWYMRLGNMGTVAFCFTEPTGSISNSPWRLVTESDNSCYGAIDSPSPNPPNTQTMIEMEMLYSEMEKVRLLEELTNEVDMRLNGFEEKITDAAENLDTEFKLEREKLRDEIFSQFSALPVILGEDQRLQSTLNDLLANNPALARSVSETYLASPVAKRQIEAIVQDILNAKQDVADTQ